MKLHATLDPSRYPRSVVNTRSLGWAVALFCVVLGALMLVLPHQFGAATYRALFPYLHWWGAAFLVAGGSLLAVTTIDLGLRITALVHLAVGGLLLWLAWCFAQTGSTGGMVAYAILGLGAAAAPFVPGPRFGQSAATWRRAPDLLLIVLAVSGIAIGATQLLLPEQYAAPMFVRLRPWLAWQDSAFAAGGVALLVAQLVRPLPRWLYWVAHLLAGGSFVLYLLAVSLPGGNLSGMAYYGGFGAAILLQPGLAPRLSTMDRRSLRTQLALATVLLIGVPLVMAVSLMADQVDRRVSDQALHTQRVLATALARSVEEFVGLHRALVAGLAASPGLLEHPPATQRSLLAAIQRSYPSLSSLGTYRADGQPIARGDSGPMLPLDGLPLWDTMQRTHGPVIGPMVTRVTQRPVIAFAYPVLDESGQLLGIVAGSVETATLAGDLNAASGDGRQDYLVDRNGAVLAHPDRGLATANLSASAPVAALLREMASGSPADGMVRFSAPGGERLAGYAVLPELGWGVVVERPASLALSSVQAGRDVAAGVLLIAVVAAAGVAVISADYLSRPLITLTAAVDALARGTMDVRLPPGGPAEVRRLAHRFAEARLSLAAASAERERLWEEERAARAAAEQATRRLDRVLEEVPCKLWEATITFDGRNLAWDAWYVNEPAVRKFFPVSVAEENAHEPYMQLWLKQRVAEDMRKNDDFVRRKVLASENYTVAFRWRRADGEIRWLREKVDVEPRGPNRWRAVGVTVDMTEEHELQEERLAHALASAAAELAERNRALLEQEVAQRRSAEEEARRQQHIAEAAVGVRDRFLAVAAHELRGPLTRLGLFVEQAQTAERETDGLILSSALRRAEAQTHKLSRLISNLLDVSRLSTGKLVLDRSRMDLAALAAEQVAHVQERATGYHLTLIAPRHLWIEADALRLEEVLANLLDNAIKFSPEGSTVTVRLDRPDRKIVRLQVEDQGTGIPPDRLPHIFEPAYQAHAPGHKSGLGLGLYVSREIVERHGGSISAECPETGGSVVSVCLPTGTPIGSANGTTNGTAHGSANGAATIQLVVPPGGRYW